MLYAQLILQTHEIHSEHNTSEIYSMFVDLHHRGKGVGTSLLAAVEQHCCLRNSTTLILYTGHSAPAVDFYLKNGFTIVGIRDPHFATKGFDLTMAKELKTEQYANLTRAIEPLLVKAGSYQLVLAVG